MNDTGSRLVLWFSRQFDPVKTAVASDVDEGMELHYAAALRRLADELEAKAKSESADGRFSQDGAADLGDPTPPAPPPAPDANPARRPRGTSTK